MSRSFAAINNLLQRIYSYKNYNYFHCHRPYAQTVTRLIKIPRVPIYYYGLICRLGFYSRTSTVCHVLARHAPRGTCIYYIILRYRSTNVSYIIKYTVVRPSPRIQPTAKVSPGRGYTFIIIIS